MVKGLIKSNFVKKSLVWFWLGIFLLFVPVVVFGADKIDINCANQTQLEGLPGIGPSKAGAIIEYRENNGHFSCVEDLILVSGIGPATLEEIKNLVEVGVDNVQDNEVIDDGQEDLADGDQAESKKDGEDDNKKEEVDTHEELQEKRKGLVVINEVLPNPVGSDDAEWIEIRNLESFKISLKDWWLEDESGKKHFLNQIIEAGGYLIFDKSQTTISLNNSGEVLKLFNYFGERAGQINYSNAEDGLSYARNDTGNYEWTSEPTKGGQNIFVYVGENENRQEVGFKQKESYVSEDASSLFNKILITEVMINPWGIDNPAKEWIEIKNTSTEAINLKGAVIKDQQNTYSFTDLYIKAHEIVAFRASSLGLNFNNLGEGKIEIVDSRGKMVDSVLYESPKEGQSYELCAGEYKWTKKHSFNEENLCVAKNKNPLAYFELSRKDYRIGDVCLIDAGESFDPDEKNIFYEWFFSDDVWLFKDNEWKFFNAGDVFVGQKERLKIKFVEKGENKISLTVKDKQGGEANFKRQVEVKNVAWSSAWENLKIVRVVPNPQGSDTENEWVELCNVDDVELNLLGLVLDDGVGGSVPYSLNDAVLLAGECERIARKESGVALNNNYDSVRILFEEKLVDEVEYEEAKEGWVLVNINEEWRWVKEGFGQNLDKNLDDLNISIKNRKTSTGFVAGDSKSLNEWRAGKNLCLIGDVLVEPGVLGANVFYIRLRQQKYNFSGLEVYSYYKRFPVDLELGQSVEVCGEVSSYGLMKRIKTDAEQDIQIIETVELPQPKKFKIKDLRAEYKGDLVFVSGEVTKKTGDYLWLDDSTAEIKIVIRPTTLILVDDIEEGVEIEVGGILSQSGEDLRILPRYAEDIKVLSVLGQTDNKKETKSGALYYVLVGLVFMVLLLLWRVYKLEKVKRDKGLAK